MKLLISHIKPVILQAMLYGLIVACAYTPIVSCMEHREDQRPKQETPAYTISEPYACPLDSPALTPEKIQLAKRQYQLRSVYYSTEPYIALDGTHWRCIPEQRRTGKVVVLNPEGQSYYQGHFIRIIKEIHLGPNDTLFERHCYEPTKPVAFVAGSVIVGAVLYWYFTKTPSLQE